MGLSCKIKYPRSQTGAALITVLVIVFLVMAIMVNISVRNYRVIRGLTNQKVMEQSDLILYSAVDFGRAGLATSGATSQIDTLNDIWAQPLPKTKVVGDIVMSGYIKDEQGKFNINDLVSNGIVNQTVVAQFSNLLEYLNLPPALAYNVAYYMAAPQYQENIGSQYTMGDPPYSPAGRPLVDLSELMLVKGMQQKWVYKLSQYVTAIPQYVDYGSLMPNESNGPTVPPNAPTQPAGTGIPVNVNTASAEVIAAKSGIPLQVAQRMVAVRSGAPFISTQAITAFLTSNGVMLSQSGTSGTTNINVNTLATQSSYFTIHAIANSGDYEFKWVAMVYRPNRSGIWPQILWQHPE
jgi:general secretion pathway protein K